MRAAIPNLVTLCNLAMGCMAIKFLFEGEPLLAVICSAIGLLADFLDGAVARMLNVSSELGKQLDSLADMVSFGVVPGVILYQLLSENTSFAYVGFLITLLSAVRLGKFNLDTRQSDQFIGLPTPACTIFIIGLLLIYEFNSFGLKEVIAQPWLLLAVTIIFSYLLVAEIPLFSLKFKHLKWKGNEIRFIFVAFSILLLIFLREAGLVLAILLYLVLSIINNFSMKKAIG
ncbi:MAG: CDP-alcohol phosphatidyltransferase family protein [Bacteroidota bacterium]